MKLLAIKKRPPHDDPISWDEVEAGLALVQFVYGISMVLGFASALGPAYRLIFPPSSAFHLSGRHIVILVALAAIILLGLRFFWVPRNLYSYLLQNPRHKHSATARLRRTTFIHVPVTMAHAFLFYILCQAFADLANSKLRFSSHVMRGLATRFVVLYALLLALNALWLLRMTPWPVRQLMKTLGAHFLNSLRAQLPLGKQRRLILTRSIVKLGAQSGALPEADARGTDLRLSPPDGDVEVTVTAAPGTPVLEAIAELIWGTNNAAFAVAAGVLTFAIPRRDIATVVFLLIACVLFILNGVIDLYNAAEDYVIFPRESSGPEARQVAVIASTPTQNSIDDRLPDADVNQ